MEHRQLPDGVAERRGGSNGGREGLELPLSILEQWNLIGAVDLKIEQQLDVYVVQLL